MIGLVLGGMLGYGYWYYIGCAGGHCTIQSDPLYSSLYGMAMGAVSLDLIKDLTQKKK